LRVRAKWRQTIQETTVQTIIESVIRTVTASAVALMLIVWAGAVVSVSL
jgi:hypothetical protein